jgi:large subunit ribosomal protein L9e
LVREFKHIKVSMVRISKNSIRVDAWFATRKKIACVKTLCTHIENMIKGVRLGFQYSMRLVYAHFPISVNYSDPTRLEIQNFLGEKNQRVVKMDPGVTIRGGDIKGKLIIEVFFLIIKKILNYFIFLNFRGMTLRRFPILQL